MHSKDDIMEMLLQCAEQIPHKSPFYGVLVGLINIEDEDFAKKVVDTTQHSLQGALNSGSCNKIRILMRFVSVLMCSNVLMPGSVIELFESLLSSAATIVDEETGNPAWQPCADFYISCVLSSLPWCAAELAEQAPEELDRVLLGIQSYLSIRTRSPDLQLAVFGLEENKFINEKDFLEDLWDRIQDLSSKGWKADSVPRPHLLFEAQLVDGKTHVFAPISCPKLPQRLPSDLSAINEKVKHEAQLKFPRRIRRLNIFPASKTENIQPIDRFVVEEYLLDVMFFFNGCRKECAFYMVGLPVPFRYEYLMAETIFSQLLLLPEAPFKPIYYTLVIIDLCKALPGAFPAVTAGAVRALFERIGDLDLECRHRLILWFSHHLSNFQFVWPWEEWAHVIDLPKWAPQRVFVQEVLEREVRLSYWDKIKQSVENAPALERLLPDRSGSNFKFGGGEGHDKTVGHAISVELSSMVKGRKTARDIGTWLEENIMPAHGYAVALEVIIQTLLDIGSKSFTHLTTVLERYGQVITKLCPDLEKQTWLIDEVSSFWKSNTQMTAIVIDRMMGYRLVSNISIVSWVFSPANIDVFHLCDRPWEVLRNAISKTVNRISDLRRQIPTLESNVVSSEKAAKNAKEEFEAAESKMEIVDGKPVQAENPGRLNRLRAYAEKTKEEESSAQDALETKRALLARSLEESKMLFISLYRNFANVLLERVPRDFKMTLDSMAVDSEGPSTMEVDQDNENSKLNQSNGDATNRDYSLGDREQWCRSTLGYVKAFSRQYASEVWCHAEVLDADVFSGNVHPLLKKAVFIGLGRSL